MFSRNPKFSLPRRKGRNRIEKPIKRECPEVTNARIGITSVNAPDQKLAVVEVAEQYANSLIGGKSKLAG